MLTISFLNPPLSPSLPPAPGYYCPAGTRWPYEFPCPRGSYNPLNGSDGEEDCLSCPRGDYCECEYMYMPPLSSPPKEIQIAGCIDESEAGDPYRFMAVAG